ncbi:MAG TPA: oxidoreductase-like domain-containing protein [Noviherbaspirillum sp.]|jgi:hypothetical protein|uniref:oxidoreductase-like domain-containing protein n=1 Tax=Noviherbaspirillum sp. TaxID=1926288 RepID=UPI002F949320
MHYFPATDALPPEPPQRPADEECCQSGCDPCVFDRYAEAMEQYRAALRAWEERQAPRAADGPPDGPAGSA